MVGEQYKRLYTWVEEEFLLDDGTRFLQLCKQEGVDLTDEFSHTEFLILKEKLGF